MNFLPIENQIIFKKNYKQKFLVILGYAVIFLLLINLVFILSYYLFLRIKKSDISTQINALNNSGVFKKSFDASEQLRNLDFQADFLKKKLKDQKNISQILENILSVRGSDPVSIEFISFDMKIKGAISPRDMIVLKGKAETRASFLEFIKNLEKEKNLFEVRSNPSNLLKEKNFNYSLEIFILTSEEEKQSSLFFFQFCRRRKFPLLSKAKQEIDG